MRLRTAEPEVVDWTRVTDGGVDHWLTTLLGDGPTSLVLVDGRSGSGKTTWAGRAAARLGAAVVHTDDLAWHHSILDWDGLLREHVVAPWRRGEPVSLVPPAWAARGRPGAVTVPACAVLVVEGVGAGRASLAAEADGVVWIQSDLDAAYRLGLARDVEAGRTFDEAAAFWEEWAREEVPFQDHSAVWSRATLLARGATDEPLDLSVWHVAHGPVTRRRSG